MVSMLHVQAADEMQAGYSWPLRRGLIGLLILAAVLGAAPTAAMCVQCSFPHAVSFIFPLLVAEVAPRGLLGEVVEGGPGGAGVQRGGLGYTFLSFFFGDE
eukprot:GHVU01032083.1.p3 GENE.GHVU01032083.1~~GHVU01032083.1.p3  ORF type:complete len:101 (-),score=6.72 GHVU01032083.1:438-740(-)